MKNVITELLKKHKSYQGISDASDGMYSKQRLFDIHKKPRHKIMTTIKFLLWARKDLRLGAKEFLKLLGE